MQETMYNNAWAQAKQFRWRYIVFTMPPAPSNEPQGRKRLTDEQETAKLMRKKTKILGADSESEDSSGDVVTKLNKSYPDYWKYEDSQHEATCSCDFCKIYFGRVPHTTPTNEIQGTSSSSTTFETVPEPQSPDAA